MTLETIVSILEQTATVVNASGWFGYTQRHDASLDSVNDSADIDKPYPQIQAIMQDDQVNLSNSISGTRIVIGFFAQDKPDSDPDNRFLAADNQLALVSSMRTLAHAFMEHLYENYDTLGVSTFRGFPEYRQMHGMGTGYSVEFTLNNTAEC